MIEFARTCVPGEHNVEGRQGDNDKEKPRHQELSKQAASENHRFTLSTALEQLGF
jgi:hypothetical protein